MPDPTPNTDLLRLPWKLRGRHEFDPVIQDALGNSVVISGVRLDDRTENLLIAAVNACKGLTLDLLEKYGVGGIKKKVDEDKREITRLRKALAIAQAHLETGKVDDARSAIDGALTPPKGEQP